MLIYHATKQYILAKIPSVIAGSKGTLGDVQRVLAKLASYDKSLYILLINFCPRVIRRYNDWKIQQWPMNIVILYICIDLIVDIH